MFSLFHPPYEKMIDTIKIVMSNAFSLIKAKKMRALSRWVHMGWSYKFVGRTNHAQIVAMVHEDGKLTPRFIFLSALSCAIAMLGMLLSSPTIVIGAMLVSPLMATIILLGFSFCILDIQQLKTALKGIIAGIFITVFVAWLIVAVSPLTDITLEILARTKPNLFDLLVATCAGLVGGYAVIKRKGETIVGVAIATALMPPLAVIGFGLGTGSRQIASGAFMLFMTNLLAIALSVMLVAKLYGFGAKHSPKHTAWQLALIAVVFGVLSLPLGIALKDIAYQGYVTNLAKGTIQEYFGSKESRVSMFNINFSIKDNIGIDALIITPKYQSEAQSDLQTLLTQKTGANVAIMLDQVITTREHIEKMGLKPVADNILSPILQTAYQPWAYMEEMTRALKQSIFFPTDYIKVEPENKLAIIHPRPIKGVTISALHEFELNIQERYPDWVIKVIPPFQAFPFIFFEIASDTPTASETEKLRDIIWALQRWDVQEVTVTGFASTVGEFKRFDNTSLAYRRAYNVLQILESAGIKGKLRSEYPSFQQHIEEFWHGIHTFHRVEIRLAQSIG